MKMIDLFAPYQVIRQERRNPVDRVAEDVAQDLVMRGLADWVVCRGHVIRLRATLREWDKRGLSVSPRPWMIDAYAQGDDRARAALDGRKWEPLDGVMLMKREEIEALPVRAA